MRREEALPDPDGDITELASTPQPVKLGEHVSKEGGWSEGSAGRPARSRLVTPVAPFPLISVTIAAHWRYER